MSASSSSQLFWNEAGERFRALASAADSFYRYRIRLVESRIAVHSKPGRSLDIGCASGELVALLYRRGFDAFGTDISPAMIEEACLSTGYYMPDAAGRFRVTQGDTPPFIETFDVLSVMGVLPYVADHPAYIQYCTEMLESGGILVISCTSPRSLYNASQVLRQLFSPPYNRAWIRRFRALLRTGIPSGGFVLEAEAKQVHTNTSLINLLRKNGFRVEENFSLYHIRNLDRHPLHRNRFQRLLAAWLGWSHIVVARKG